MSFEDDNGNLVTVKVKYGHVTLYTTSANGGNITKMVVTNTGTSSTVSIHCSGGVTTIGEVIVLGSLKSFTAKTTDLLGDIVVDGKLASLVLRNVADGHLIDIGGGLTAADITTKDKVKMTFAKVADKTLISHLLPISYVTAIEWLDTDVIENDLITTQSWIGKITIKGKKYESDGNFQADLDIDGTNYKGYSLITAKIAGEIGCNWNFAGDVSYIYAASISNDCTINAAGFIKKIYAKNSLGGSISAEWIGKVQTKGDLTAAIVATAANAKGMSIGALYAGNVGDVSLSVPGGVKSIKVAEWLDGDITANWIGSIKVSGNRRAGIAGNFGANVTLTGTPAEAYGLKSAKVYGNLLGSTVWEIDGKVGSVRIYGDVNGWVLGEIHKPSYIKSVKLGNVTEATIRSQGYLGAVTATQWQSGEIQGGYIKSIKVTGEFGANVSANSPNTKYALAKAYITGDVTSGVWEIIGNVGSVTVKGTVLGADELNPVTIRATGSISKITLGASKHADFLAGVNYDDLLTVRGFPIGRADFIDPTNTLATIKLFKISGIPGSNETFFEDTNVSAVKFGKIMLRNADFSEGGIFVANSADPLVNTEIYSVAHYNTNTGRKWSWSTKSGEAFPGGADFVDLLA